MSGRSAIVRAKNDKRASHAKNTSYSNVRILPASAGRRDNASDYDGNQTYEQEPVKYPNPQPLYGAAAQRPAREIVVESAIEKSGIRSQVDDLSDNFRGRLGRMFGGSKGSKSKGGDGAWNESSMVSSSTMNAVPSLSYSASTAPPSQAAPSSYPIYNSRSKSSATRQAGANYQQGSSLSVQSQGRPEISIFAGHRERRSVTPWKNLARPPESLTNTVDTLVKLFVQTQEDQPLAAFYINSEVLRKNGCQRWLDMLMEYLPSSSGDTETVSSNASVPDYNGDGSSSFHDGSRYKRTPKIKFELYLDCPDEALDQNPLNWAMSTRNFFALMHDHDYLCGRTLFEALSQLATRLKENPDGLPASATKLSTLLDYINRHRFLDGRNSPAYALSVLAFSQLPIVQWKEASVESFVHCVGMRLYGAYTLPEAQHMSPYMNILITNMANEMRKRLTRAQKYLSSLDFSEMWPARVPQKAIGRLAYDRFRSWLLQYIMRSDPTLRESVASEEIWITFERIERYKRIFHSLFNYLVNRDVAMDDAADTNSRQNAIISKSGVYLKPDPHGELPMTAILTGFDVAKGFPHLPAPYPLVPPSQSPWKSRHGNSKKPATSAEEDELEARSLTYADASNFELVAHDTNMDPVIAEFVNFEQTDEIAAVDPRDARLGRWVLIYGALQILATIETVTPGVRYREGARYCMSCKVTGLLPWIKEHEGELQELRSPSHEMAYPFTAPSTWPSTLPKPRTGSYRSIVSPEYGDGRKRPNVPLPPSSPLLDSSDKHASTTSDRLSHKPTTPTSDRRQASASGRSGRGGLVEPSNSEDKAARERFEADKARGRREKAFGFTNYKPEAGW